MKKIIILISLTFLIAQDPISLTSISDNFILDNKNPEIEILYPSGNESFSMSENINIEWNATDDSFNNYPISIELINFDNNAILNNWDLLENTGSYQIQLPDLANIQGFINIYVEDSFGNENNAQSGIFIFGVTLPISFSSESNNFTLDSKPPEITITHPNGGEEFILNESVDVNWVSFEDNSALNPITISISTTESEQYSELMSGIANSGNLSISMHNITNNARIKLSIIDFYGNIGEDISDDYFSVLPIPDIVFLSSSNSFSLDSKAPTVEWLSPNDGGLLPSGENIEAEWLATDDSFNDTPVTVDINESGNSVTTLSNQTIDGLQNITLPNIVSESISFKITATDNFGNSSFDESDNLFSLKDFGCTDETANNYNELAEIDDESCFYSTILNISGGNNLISLPGPLFDDTTQTFIQAIEQQCGNEIYFILGQGLGLFNTENGWSGNLNNLDNLSGYWINASSSCDFEFEINKYSDECLAYNLDVGNNLVSYAGENNLETIDALGGEVLSGLFNFILSQGQGLFLTENGWSGNLTTLENKKGYWLNTNISNPSFQWGSNCESVEPVAKVITDNNLPEEYQVDQSTEQAFYLIKDILIDKHNPEDKDIILAYNCDILVGSAVYNSEITVLPVMGRDVSEQTIGFLEDGEIPTLRLVKTSGESIPLQANLEGFSNLLVSEVQSVTGSTVIIPTDYALHLAYPNPFNPVTNISFGLPMDTQVTLNIYDVEGRKISTLNEGIRTAGNHTIEWNAEGYPSGVYFVKLDAGEFTQTQKLMLVK